MNENSQAFREIAAKGTTQAKEGFEKLSAATTEATGLLKDSYSTAIKGAQDYNSKLIEFVRTNVSVSFDFAQKLSGVTSPSEFMEMSTQYARKQFETMAEQTRELAALAQRVTLATTEHLKTGVTVTKALAQSS
jgi:phasin